MDLETSDLGLTIIQNRKYVLYVFVLSIRIIRYTRDGQIWYTRGNTVYSYTQLPRAVNWGI